MHLNRGLKGKAQTWSGLRPVKQNIPIWSVMWDQLWVDPEDKTRCNHQQQCHVPTNIWAFSSLFFFSYCIPGLFVQQKVVSLFGCKKYFAIKINFSFGTKILGTERLCMQQNQSPNKFFLKRNIPCLTFLNKCFTRDVKRGSIVCCTWQRQVESFTMDWLSYKAVLCEYYQLMFPPVKELKLLLNHWYGT